MRECHVCLYMCDDDAELCPLCGAELKEKETEQAEEVSELEPITNPVLAASADSPVTAEIFTDILSENGIAYSIDEKGDFLHSGFGGGFFAVDIYVDEKNLDIAKELYKNLTENQLQFEDFDGEE